MKISTVVWMALGAGFLGGCAAEQDAPPIVCEPRALQSAFLATEPALGAGCSAGQFPATVVYVLPRTLRLSDPVRTTDNQYLSELAVHVQRSAAFVTFCEGLQCTPSRPELELRTDTTGNFAYTMGIDSLGIGLPAASGEVTGATGEVSLETYGAGQACGTTLEIRFSCLAAVTTFTD